MNIEYAEYCDTNPWFYDEIKYDENKHFTVELPMGWEKRETDDWTYCNKVNSTLPIQGWKIHVSATLRNARRILKCVADYCVAKGICFKYVPTYKALHLKNGKNANRASSGKFITIYPITDGELADTLSSLDMQLKGQKGPYILSDLRWNEGPLYVRYGGFKAMTLKREGTDVPAISRPDGSLVPDKRVPYFIYPQWAHIPKCLVTTIKNFEQDATLPPFQVERAIKISNGGGVYKGRYHDCDVLIKEGRPYAGLDGNYVSAYQRIDNEASILKRLQNIPGIPTFYDHIHVWEHNYVLMEFIDGDPLTTYVSKRNTLIQNDEGKEQYVKTTIDIIDQAKQILDEIHKRNITIGDIQISNIILDRNNKIHIIDFEVATDSETNSIPLGAPGFVTKTINNRFRRDEYALARIALYLFVPFNPELQLAPSLELSRLDFIKHHFGPEAFRYLQRLFKIADPDSVERSAGQFNAAGLNAVNSHNLRAVSSKIISGVMTVRNSTSLVEFPSDICVYQGRASSLSAGYGLAGIILSAWRTGAGVDEVLIDKLDNLVAHKITRKNEDYGLFTGLGGSVCVLSETGRQENAIRYVSFINEVNLQSLSLNMSSGLAGILLAIVSLRSEVREADEVLKLLVTEIEKRVCSKSVNDLSQILPDAGLSNGCSGLAVALSSIIDLKCFASDKERLSSLIAQLLHADLHNCKKYKDGSLQVDDDYRLLPYLGKGSAGILVGHSLAQASGVCTFNQKTVSELIKACCSPYYMESGLVRGVAGIIDALALEYCITRNFDISSILDVHLEDLSLHTMLDNKGNYFFAGAEGLRISTDLLTGTSGIALVLKDLTNTRKDGLPLSWLPIKNSNFLWDSREKRDENRRL